MGAVTVPRPNLYENSDGYSVEVLGRTGLREVANQCLQKTAYLRGKLAATGKVEFPFGGPVYNEFTVRTMVFFLSVTV